jgi:hypothetical protein
MAKDEPLWRDEMAKPGSMLRPFRRGFPPPLPIPAYVQRWLLVTAFRRPDRLTADQLAANIITEACHAFHRLHAPPLPFSLARGVTIDPPGHHPETLQQLHQWSEGDKDDPAADLIIQPCVSNGAYAWFFFCPAHGKAIEQFTQWVADTWNIKRKTVDKAGWPVIALQKGDWPFDPRLLPGSPVAVPALTEPLLHKS